MVELQQLALLQKYNSDGGSHSLCFCKSNCVSLCQVWVLVCDSNSAVAKIFSKGVCEQSYFLHWLAPRASFRSLREARVKYSCSRMGRENLHPVEVQAPLVVGMSSHRFWQAMGNQVCAGASCIIKAISS